MQVLAKKKSVADEAGMVLQSKVRQLQAATTSWKFFFFSSGFY